MTSIFIGVDPGTTPSICFLDREGKIIKCTLLKKENGTFPHAGYMNELRNVVHMNTILNSPGMIQTCSELPHSVFGASAKANFMFGYSVGACIQGLHMLSDVCNLVSPKNWQKVIWQEEDIVYEEKNEKKKKDTKATSLNATKRILGASFSEELFLPTARSKVINHNMVDAFLIAYYCHLINS